MAKKKKKLSAKQSNQGTPSSSRVETPAFLDSLEVRLVQKHIATTTLAVEKTMGISLSKMDARTLDVMPSEKLFLLSKHPEGTKYSQIAVGVLLQTSSKAPMTLRSPVSRKEDLSAGFARVPSSFLRDHLFPAVYGETSESTAIDFPLPMIPSTPVTPKGSFSFRSEVNTSNTSFSSPMPSPKPQPQLSVTLVALDSDLGDTLKSRLCREASVVQCRLVEEPVGETAAPVLESLMRASYDDTYVQINQKLPLSFQGRTRTVEIVGVDARNGLTDVTRSLEQLDVGDQNDERQRLLQDISPTLPISYHVTGRTRIQWEGSESTKAQSTNYVAVAGLEPIQQALHSLIAAPLVGEHRTRGILLFGPSGVGKSSLARQIAEESDRDVSFVNCALLQTKTGVVGDAERALSRYFQDSHSALLSKRGKLLIFDDIHLICPKRGGPDRGADQLGATLLALMDGVSSKKSIHNIVVIAITQDPSRLDPALRRPGRLDNEIEVPLPDSAQARANILRLHLKHAFQFDVAEASWEDLGKLAKGFSGADCALAVKEAVRLALSETTTAEPHVVTLKHLKTAIRTTKPSIIQSVTVEIPKVYWDMIGGMESVKKELRDVIDMSDEKLALFEKLRIPPPRGILLYGPPGCSKTLMARALATEGHYNFLAVKGPELLSKWLGESERALASLFRRARMASPCIVFFDEIDAIASRRGDSASSGRLLSQLLTELDGVTTKTQQRVVVVAATNRPDLLDRALTRPGRIDRQIYVGMPDLESRRRILEISLAQKSCKDLDLDVLSQECSGLSGAELVAVCRDAALLALEEEKDTVGQNHLLRASGSMQRQITPSMLSFYADYRKQTALKV